MIICNTLSFLCSFLTFSCGVKDLVCSFVLFCSYSIDTVLQFFKVLNITADQKKFFRKAFHAYYDAAAELLQSEHSVRLLILLKLLPFFLVG